MKRLAFSEAMLSFSLRLTTHFQTAVLETLQYSDNTLAALLRPCKPTTALHFNLLNFITERRLSANSDLGV